MLEKRGEGIGKGEVPEEGEGDLAGGKASEKEEGKSESFGMHSRRGGLWVSRVGFQLFNKMSVASKSTSWPGDLSESTVADVQG